MRAAAQAATGIALLYRGRFPAAREHFAALDPLLANAAPPSDLDWQTMTGGPAFHALTLAVLGYTVQAGAQIQQAIVWAGGRGAFALAYCLSIAVRVLIVLRDEGAVCETATRLVALAEDGHYHQFLNQGLCALGWAQARAGETTRGLAMLREGHSRMRNS